ncbi:MAG: hypothetical protein L6Q57_05275 [Alphaproteobacteria bacterium]|nr:hypothetical protein [Alphaproteobacteria bacterium]
MNRSFFRRYLVQGLCLAALGVGGGIYAFGPAFGQKGNVFDPDTQWSVSQIGGQGLDGDSYCAVARRFEHNAILTIARNGQGESSLAVDFQTPQFPVNQSMPVTLDPGAGEQRQFDVQPVSGAAFVVRLGSDARFFESLTRTGLLRVEALGQSYHFNLADLDKGEFKLNGCVKDLPAPLPVAQAPSMPSATPPAMPVESVKGEIVAPAPVVAPVVKQALSEVVPPAASEKAIALKDDERRAYEQKIEKLTMDLITRDAKIASLARLEAENKRLVLALKDQDAMRQHVASLEGEVQVLRAKLSQPQVIEPSAGTATVIAAAAKTSAPPSVVKAEVLKDEPKKNMEIAQNEKNPAAVPVANVEKKPVSEDTQSGTAEGDASRSAAQRYEEQLRAGLNNKSIPEPITAVQEPAPVPVSTAKAEEPAAPVKAEAVDAPQAPAQQETVKKVAVQEPPVSKTQNEEAPAALRAPSAVADAAPKLPPAPAAAEPDRFPFQDLLVRASLTPRDGIVPVKGAAVDAGRKAYQWRSGNAFGSGEVGQAAGDQAFESSVKAYIERTQKRCEGDFAVVPERSVDTKTMRMDTYEVACMGKTMDSSVALVFIHQGDTFAALAHEGPTAQLEDLMTMRDKLISAAKGS